MCDSVACSFLHMITKPAVKYTCFHTQLSLIIFRDSTCNMIGQLTTYMCMCMCACVHACVPKIVIKVKSYIVYSYHHVLLYKCVHMIQLTKEIIYMIMICCNWSLYIFTHSEKCATCTYLYPIAAVHDWIQLQKGFLYDFSLRRCSYSLYTYS